VFICLRAALPVAALNGGALAHAVVDVPVACVPAYAAAVEVGVALARVVPADAAWLAAVPDGTVALADVAVAASAVAFVDVSAAVHSFAARLTACKCVVQDVIAA
jgi:hypothetical protein